MNEEATLVKPESLDVHVPLELLLDVITDDAFPLLIEMRVLPAPQRHAATLENRKKLCGLGNAVLEKRFRPDRHVPVPARLKLGDCVRHQNSPRWLRN